MSHDDAQGKPESDKAPFTVFVCGRRGGGARSSPRMVVPRGREVALAIDAMPKPKKPPSARPAPAPEGDPEES